LVSLNEIKEKLKALEKENKMPLS